MDIKFIFNEKKELVAYVIKVNENIFTVDLTGNVIDYSIDRGFERERTLV